MACETGFLKAEKDQRGNYVGSFINGTDDAVGVVSMTALAGNFVPDMLNADKVFHICPEAVGVIKVQLSDGTDFTITLVQTTANLGFFLPINCIKVYKSGTTATFSVGY